MTNLLLCTKLGCWVDFAQIIVGICTVFLTFASFYALQQINLLRKNNELELIKKTRGEWLDVSKILISNPDLVPTYLNKEAKNYFDGIKSKSKRKKKLKKYAFADLFFEIIAQHYYIFKGDNNKVVFNKIYPEDWDISSSELKEIWEEWGLKEDHTEEFRAYVEKGIFKKH